MGMLFQNGTVGTTGPEMWTGASSGKMSPGYNTLPEWEGVATGFEGSVGDQEPLGFWDPAGFTKDGDVEKFKRRREVEIKHGRVESVVVCDVTDADAVMSAMAGCEAVVIATSAKPAPTGEMKESGGPIFGFPNGQPEAVDWLGQKSQIDAAKAQGLGTHVVICSSMGGTDPNHMLNSLGRETLEDGSTEGGDILKWKRKAE